MRRTNELLNSEGYQHFADEENIEGEPSNLEQRPRMATPAMARFIRNVFLRDLHVLDRLLEADRERRQRRREEGIPFVDTEVKEKIRYGEELEERKAQDIFAQTSTTEFMAALRPEADEDISDGQNNIELHFMAARESYNRLHTNKISLIEDAFSKPLQPEPKIKIEIPKPEPCEDPMKVEPDYECALDKLGQLDKQYKDKNFGLYGKYFRPTHGRNLNFYKYRKANPVGHPHARLRLMKNKFLIHIVRCILTSQLLRNILIDALLFMVV